MSKLGTVQVALIVLVAVITGTAIVAGIIIIPRGYGSNKRFGELIHKTDTAINSGSYTHAGELLNLAFDSAKTAKEYTMILKRGYRIFIKTGDIAALSDFSEKALRKKPDDADIGFIAAYAGVRNNNNRITDQLTAKQKKTDQRLLSLKAEALILSDDMSGLSGLESPSPPLKYLRLFNSHDPQFFEDSAAALSDTELAFDAMLLYASEKKFGKAYQLFNANKDNKLFTVPGIYISFDAGEYRKTEEMITAMINDQEQDAALTDLYGDIMVLTGKADEAFSLYRNAVVRNPSVSETAYLNLSYLYRKKEDRENAFEWLKAGKQQFPGSSDIIFEASKFFLFLGDKKTALSIAESAPVAAAKETRLILLRLLMQQESMNQQAYRTGLWELYNSDPENELVCRFLVLYLVSIDDISGALSALTLFDKKRGIKTTADEYLPWVLHYRGICEMINSDYRKALALIDASLKIKEEDVAIYHKAILLIRMKNYRAAREELWKIAHLPVSSIPDREFISMATFALGRALFLSGNRIDAAEQVERALDIDPENYQAIQFRKELEEHQ